MLTHRHWDKIAFEPNTGCWLWLGAMDHGYGSASVGRKAMRAHRAFYVAHRGPVPEGLVLDHLCKQKSCVNPDHLEAVTQRLNVQRHYSASDFCKKGHRYPDDGSHILSNGWRRCPECKAASQKRYNDSHPERAR